MVMLRKYSLYTLLFIAFLILAVLSFISVYFSVTQHRKDLIKTAIEEKTHLAETVNETLASPLWIYRLALVPGMERAFINEISSFKDVRYIRVVSSDGTIFKSSIEEEWGKIIREPDISQVLESYQPIVKDQTFEGEKVKLIIYPGHQNRTIWIAFSLEEIKSDVGKMLVRDISVALGTTFFSLFVLFVILRQIITPLRKITLACQEIRKGNLNVKIDLKSGNEIGELAATFNRTIGDLKKSQDALEKSKATLEIKVKKRTQELSDLTKGLEQKVEERTKELQERVNELERFHELTVGRELRMIELKKEIKKLKKKQKKS